MRAKRHALCSILLGILLGCGGSGSSGFDAGFAEGLLIQQALDEQRCVRGAGALTICPSGVDVSDPIGLQPGPGGIRVRASVEPAGLVDCSGAGDAPACSLTVGIEIDALPPGFELRVAFRPLPNGRWSVGAALDLAASDDDFGTPAPVPVDLAGDAGASDAVQIAVLVFDTTRAAVPPEVDQLGQTGAGYAFVLPPLPITRP